MKWPNILSHGNRYATVEDVRKIFADYHDTLHWLARFLLTDEVLAPACVVDACNIAERQSPMFHDWLTHWAAHATLLCALRMQRDDVAALVPKYEQLDGVDSDRPLFSPEDLQLLVDNAEVVRTQLDVLCRFVLIMYGIGKETREDVGSQLRLSESAVVRAYAVAFDTFRRVSVKTATNANKAGPSGGILDRLHHLFEGIHRLGQESAEPNKK